MLQRVTVEGIKFPRLYLAENNQDVKLAKQNGIPYIKWQYGMTSLIKSLLRPTIEKMFPGICWDKVLGEKKPIESNVIICNGSVDDNEIKPTKYDSEAMLEAQYKYDEIVDDLHDCKDVVDDEVNYIRDVDIADSRRDCINDYSGSGYGSFTVDTFKVEDYIGDLSSSVDINVLQELGMLPKFVGDIADCIKFNIGNGMRWTEGYNKKLGAAIGNFRNPGELPNLLIIDISWSIPDGIAATMLTLADTLRSQCNAELIITSARSGYYPTGVELPKPQTLRDYYRRSNEAAEFIDIINNHIAGREFGHVISFGDNDCPGDFMSRVKERMHMVNTKVHEVHHYHTTCRASTGYAKWADDCNPDKIHYNNDWCRVMNGRYSI